MGYEEEIFTRSEKQFSRDEDRIEWLSSFGGKGGGNAYELDALRVAENLRNTKRIENEIVSTTEYEDLEKLKRETNSLPGYTDKYKRGLLNGIDIKQRRISEELSRLTEERRKLTLEETAVDTEEEKEITKVEKQSVKELQKSIEKVERIPDAQERKIILAQEQLRIDQEREESLREVYATSEDKRKRLNAKRQLLKIEQRRNK